MRILWDWLIGDRVIFLVWRIQWRRWERANLHLRPLDRRPPPSLRFPD